MHKSKLKQMTLAVSLACFSLYAEAAGLGKLTVLSGLGEPLNAEIEVESASPEEIGSLSAAIASPEAYAVQGLQRTAVQESIQVAVEKKSNGTPILKLTSTQPVTDPFLEMLVQVDWSTGRLVREFTVLLDPPGYDAATPPTTNAGNVTAPEVPTSTKQPSSPPVSEAVITESGIQPMPEKMAAKSPADEVKTARGDTLSKIAKEMQIEGVSLDRMLVGLYQENKNAFVNNNMNQLKVGQIIKLPSEETLKSISRAEAAQEIKVHANDWSGYKNKLASAVAESKPASEETKSQKSEGKLVAPKVDAPAKAVEGPKDVVKLSKTEEPPKKGDAKTDAKTFKNKLDALQEEGLAREKSIKEASERAAALEKQVDDLQKLMTLKNKSMADVQKQAAETTKSDASPKVVLEPKKPEAKVEEVKPAPAETNAETKPAEVKPVEPVKPAETAAVEADKPKDPPKKPKLTPKKVAPEADPFAQEPGLMDGVDPVLLGGGAGLLALLGGGWFYLRNRRKKSLDSFEKGILTAGALKANTVFGNTSGGTVDTGDTSFLTDFSQTAGGMIDTHDVDPIAEAEVYMAYGREAQAEEILKDAISKEPTRYELHLKLLEIYAARSDTSAFEATAGELYTTLGASHPVWLKVAEMGHAMEPSNPLYDVAGGASAASTPSAVPASSPEPTPMDDTQILDVTDFAQAEEVSDSTLDFSLDMESASSSESNDMAMDFDIDSPSFEAAPDLSLPELNAEKESDINVATEANDLDFQLDMSALDSVSEDAKTALEDVSALVVETKPDFDQTMPSMPSFETSSLDLSDNKDITINDTDLTMPSLESTTDASGLDFDFDLGESADAQEPVNTAADFAVDDSNITDIEMTDITLDDNVATSADGESEDVNTKLDLVTAYIDMGDNEGARELLDEIIKEGGPKQVARAKRLLADIV